MSVLAPALMAGQAPNPAAPSVHGRVLDARKQPVEGAMIFLRAGMARERLMTQSGRDGSYSFAPLELGVDYELHAEHEGRASGVRPLRVSGRGERVTMNLILLPPILFEDVTARAGLDFIQRNGATGHFYQPEIMIAGVAALDYDNDGCTDIFFANGASFPELKKTGPEFSNHLYRNNCNTTFTDVTATAGLAGEGYSMGVAAADFDNDGIADLFVAGLHGNTLYHNRGDGTFENVTAKSGLGAVGADEWAVAAGWFDYDNDGWLDLFVSNYVSWSVAGEVSCTAQGRKYYCHPRVYKGLPNRLYHNNHDGTFTDVSVSSGIAHKIGKGMGVAFGDCNGDGLLDVFVANDSEPNFLFQNMGGGRFRETALEAGAAYAFHGNAVAGMGADFRDFDDDGMEDLVLSAMYFDTFPLYRNRGHKPYFEDQTVSSRLANATRNLTGWSLGMYDLDNDGHKDLFVATSHFPGSEPYANADAALPNHVFRNLGNGAFEDVSALAGADFQRPALFHGAAFADFDNDGRIDVVVTAHNSPARLFRNVSPAPAHWIALRLTGTRSGREGLGARVKLTLPNARVQYNRATTSVGYASSSEPLVRFGMGPYESAREIEIRWPGGRVQVLTAVQGDRIITVREP